MDKDKKIEKLEKEIKLYRGQVWKQRLEMERCYLDRIKLKLDLSKCWAKMGGWKGYAKSLEKQSTFKFPAINL